MIEKAIRLYLTQKCINMGKNETIRKVSKLFRCPKDRVIEIYESWRYDYVRNKINIL